MINKDELEDTLIKQFCKYQHELERPLFSVYDQSERNASVPPWIIRFNTDVFFRSKVESLVKGVMHIVIENEKRNS